jgi:heme-degrading monooxygenase HmoA
MQQNQQSSSKTHVGFATTPGPPYYAVIFTSQRTEGDGGYEAMAQAMFELALKQPGCLGAESVRDEGGLGITVAYFTDESAIRAWQQNSEHLVAQRLGKERWYSHYELRVAKVERAYSGPRSSTSLDDLVVGLKEPPRD